MKIISGTYTHATIHTDDIDTYSNAQIEMICNHSIFKDSKIHIMPDVHPGTYGPVGLSMTIQDKIIPNLIGIDIGCGVTVAKVKQTRAEYQKLDALIKKSIPSGFHIRTKPHRFSESFDFSRLFCHHIIHQEKAILSLGTLGSGNHFIELDQDTDGFLYIIIHSGSRHLGKEVAEYYQNMAYQSLQSREEETKISHALAYVEGPLFEQYIHDVQVVQEYATLNRTCILDEIVRGMKFKVLDTFSISHNYIEQGEHGIIVRKGAIPANKGIPVAIPIHMKDGVILGTGKGNPDWNYSAPHGSGRLYKRTDVKNHYTVSQFKKEMKGIHCFAINSALLEESPFAYRDMEQIIKYLSETIEIQKILKPVYNFKS